MTQIAELLVKAMGSSALDDLKALDGAFHRIGEVGQAAHEALASKSKHKPKYDDVDAELDIAIALGHVRRKR